ncbi:MAG: hypothetical protein AAFR61_24780 [Bacteroidota bacterium]
MKTLLPFLLCLCMASLSYATTLRVNNTPGSNAPYTDLTTAHSVASPGDTLYIEGSNVNYGSLTITKKLVIIGPGYFTAQNECTPASLPAEVHVFTLQQTITNDPASGAAGTEIVGISFTDLSISGLEVYVNDVKVIKCRINRYLYIRDVNVTGTTMIQNYCEGQALSSLSINPGLNNIVFSNNIVNGNFSIVDNSSGMIQHNVFLGSTFNVEVFNGSIRSNISTSTNTNSFKVSTTGQGSLTDNTAAAGQFGSSNGNNTANPTTLFLGAATASTDGEYQLLPSAILVKGNAHDGTDRGAFGGNTPYVLSGVPDIPFIKTIILSTTVFPANPLEVRIEAHSGN